MLYISNVIKYLSFVIKILNQIYIIIIIDAVIFSKYVSPYSLTALLV